MQQQRAFFKHWTKKVHILNFLLVNSTNITEQPTTARTEQSEVDSV